MKPKTMREFFVSCQIGFEDELVKELSEARLKYFRPDGTPGSSDVDDLQVIKGGISFHADLDFGLQLNFYLKTAHRILLRVKTFECTHLQKLFQHFSKISFDQLQGIGFKVEAAAQKSKINNEKRILEIADQAWKKQISETASQTVLIRADDDVFTVSIDTSGEHLHKRGWRKNIGEAPLRETMAQYMLRVLQGEDSFHDLASVTLMDPFCGSGTLLIEASRMGIAESQRRFAFQEWKGVGRYLKEAFIPEYINQKISWVSLQGFDKDPSAVENAVTNASAAGLLGGAFSTKDFRELNSSAGRLWICSNPPYGDRLEIDFTFKELVEKLQSLKPDRMALLLPRKALNELPPPLRPKTSYQLSNGGIPVTLCLW